MAGKTTKVAQKKPAAKTVTKTTKQTKTTKVQKKGFCWKKVVTIAICILIPLAVGILSSVITGSAMKKFDQFNKPPLAPPAWLFPVAWTILYILMGIASYLIFVYKPKTKKEIKIKKAALILYVLQLVFNFVWSPLFFLAGNFFFALIWLIAMWLMIVVIMLIIRERCMPAMWCLLPYLLWCLFATYLNAGIMMFN